MYKGRSRNDILVEFIEHPGFQIMFGDVIERQIQLILGKIADPTIEEDDRKYSNVQIERKLLKVVEKLKLAPKQFFAELALNENQLLSEIGELKKDELNKMS